MLNALHTAVFSLALVISSCQETVDSKRSENRKLPNYTASESTALKEERGQLMKAEFVARIRQATIDNAYQKRGFTAKNDVYAYRLSYRSEDFNGNSVLLSAALYVPVSDQVKHPFISVQHGTITASVNAPSQNFREGLLEASQGYIALAPDYHGFGQSQQLIHPYLLQRAYELAGLDALYASADFLIDGGLQLDGLYLKGYSEGGYATVALQKAIETQFNTESKLNGLGLDLRASAPGAGPYQMGAVGKRLVAAETIHSLYITKVITAYKSWLPTEVTGEYSAMLSLEGFGLKNELQLQSLMEETIYSGDLNYFEILERLPKEKTAVLSAEIIAAFAAADLSRRGEVEGTDADRSGLLTALEANNVAKFWSPAVPTRLYHCVSDEVVPYAASISAKLAFDFYDDMDAATANELVTVISIADEPGEGSFGHGNCPGVHQPLDWFAELRAAASESPLD